MAHLAPAGPVYQAGTLSGNPVAVAAGLATLRAADASVYAALDAHAARLGDMIDKALAAEGVPHRVQYAGNLLSVFFTEDQVHDYAGAQAAATWRFPAFFHALLERGVYAPPSAFEAWFVSAALDDDCFGVLESARRRTTPRTRCGGGYTPRVEQRVEERREPPGLGGLRAARSRGPACRRRRR